MASHKILDQGYWKSKLFYWQSLMYYYLYSARFRSIVWFCPLNPSIHMAGMLDENKSDIYDILPEEYLPKTQLITSDMHIGESSALTVPFPMIAKPNIGLKGWKVIKLFDFDEFVELRKNDGKIDWILQEFIDFEEEYAVLCTKHPGNGEIQITSVTRKIYPFVIGKGKDTLKFLIETKNDAYLNVPEVLAINNENLDRVVQRGERYMLHNIGNYSRGSKFYNANELIDNELIAAFTPIMLHLKGIFFCRFDLKTHNVAAMKRGEFKVLEMNGAKSEPLHIYDPNFGWLASIKTIHCHWVEIASIVRYQLKHANAVLPTTQEGLAALRGVRKVFEKE